MKRRHIDPADGYDPEQLLLRAFEVLAGSDELGAFLRDLCTPAELEALRDRWRVVPHLLRGRTYREIHELTGVSVTTIGRVARFLSAGHGGYRIAAERVFGGAVAPQQPEGARGGTVAPASAKVKPADAVRVASVPAGLSSPRR